MIEPLESRIAPATFTVINTNDAGPGSLRDALDRADTQAGADTIVFRLPAPPANSANIIELTGELVSKGNVTIKGPGAGRLIIDGNDLGRVLRIDDGVAATDSPTTISGLSIVNGQTTGDGGGVLSNESLTLKSVVVSGNIGEIGGGVAVFGDATAGTKASVISSFIAGNRSNDTGGGLAFTEVKAAAISKTTVLGNSAQSAGGIFASTDVAGTAIAISGSVISSNFSAGSAGGIFVADNNPSATSKAVISGTKITGNHSAGAADGGGGVFVGAGDAVISGSIIGNNSALNAGGGLDAKGFTSLVITGSNFSGNETRDDASSTDGGGGLHIQGNNSGDPLPVKISGTRVIDNRSTQYGGGLHALNGIALTISGSTFSGNTAGETGGGLATRGTGAGGKVDLTVIGSVFADNVGSFGGGGIEAVSSDGVVSIAASKVAGNQSSFGGAGIEARSTVGSVTIRNVVASGNDGSDGGGLFIFNTPDFKVIGGRFTGNAAFEGGGIHILNATGSILGANITGNAAISAGGGVFADAMSVVTLQVAKVIANSAPVGPNVSGPFTFV
jgi:hypothetical protein